MLFEVCICTTSSTGETGHAILLLPVDLLLYLLEFCEAQSGTAQKLGLNYI